jgi:glycosyltransferase involved in cell wall biosynthesis
LRVVWVTPALPHPQNAGGWAHEFELIRSMAARHDIEVVSSDLEGPLDAEALKEIGVGFTRVRWRSRQHPHSALGVALRLPVARPNLILWLRRDRLRALASTLRPLIDRTRPDLVHITLGELAPLLGEIEVPTALLLFDSLTREIEGRHAHESRPRRRAQLRLEARRMRRFERKWYARAAGLASVSSVDAGWFEQLLGRPVTVIENSVPDRFFDAPDRARSGNIVAFVGSLNHHPNADAIKWLVAEIWPRVCQRFPSAQLVVVGRDDPAGVMTRALRPLVEGAGGRLDVDVPDIRPYYWDAATVVAPIRLGGGMRSKVIHAMACGAPVVATPTALEGVPQAAATEASVGSTAEELAAGVLAVLSDQAAARARGEAAARGVEQLRTSAIAERFEAWWKGLIS